MDSTGCASCPATLIFLLNKANKSLSLVARKRFPAKSAESRGGRFKMFANSKYPDGYLHSWNSWKKINTVFQDSSGVILIEGRPPLRIYSPPDGHYARFHMEF